MHIACAASEEYAPHCAAMLHSLLSRHAAGQCHIHYLHVPELPQTVKTRVRAMCESLGGRISFHPVDSSVFEGLPIRWHISVATWYRLLLPKLLPELDRVIYIDADAIVTDRLDALWQLDMSKHFVAAVDNAFVAQSRDRIEKLQPSSGRYFNGGVLLLNLVRMRDTDCTRRALEYAREHAGALTLLDQDVMNVMLGSERVVLHPRWNCQNSLFYFPESRAHFGEAEAREATSHPAIVHFEGPGMAKPWHYLCKHPYRSNYFAHRRQTPWPDPVIEGRSFGARLLRPLPTARTIFLLESLRRGRRRLGSLLRRLGPSAKDE